MALNALSTTGSLILDPLYTLWLSFLAILPGIIAAILILILGYCVAFLIGHVIRTGLEKIGLSKHIQRAHLTKAVGHTNVAAVTGEIVKWFVFIIFLQVAAEVLNLGSLSSLLNTFVLWLPNVLVAIVILFAGIALAHYIEMKMHEHTSMKGMRVATAIIKVVILLLVVIIGLEQIGVQVDVLENGFLIILGSIGLGIALALGIGLGLGLRRGAEDIVKDIRKNL